MKLKEIIAEILSISVKAEMFYFTGKSCSRINLLAC